MNNSKMKTKERKRKDKKLYLRTRERQQLRVYNLQLDLIQLRQEIAGLEHMRCLLYARILHNSQPHAQDGRFARTLRMYYRFVRHGMLPVVLDPQTQQTVATKDVVQSMFDEDMALGGDACGRQGFMARLMLLATLMGRVQVTVEDVYVQTQREGDEEERGRHQEEGENDDEVTKVTMVVRTTLTAVINAFMVAMVLPHVADYPAIQRKLLGQQYVGSGVAFYTFDTTTGLIVSAEVRFSRDAFARLLDDPKEVRIVLGVPCSDDEVFDIDEEREEEEREEEQHEEEELLGDHHRAGETEDDMSLGHLAKM